ncbi:MAG: DUF378 domain-containing protein [Candidatus Zixiibacteriota bacterium]|nr:MAG: DUF378 domain-containing protein [candidate division Zixibacteria bacterium]
MADYTDETRVDEPRTDVRRDVRRDEVVRRDSLTGLDWTALILTIVGGLNWGLIGIFDFNLVAAIFGSMSILSRIIYALVGLSALYLAFVSPTFCKKTTTRAGTASRMPR